MNKVQKYNLEVQKELLKKVYHTKDHDIIDVDDEGGTVCVQCTEKLQEIRQDKFDYSQPF